MKRTKVYVVRVIVDPRNASQDYWLPENYARTEFDAGRLGQMQIGRSWEYEDPQRRHITQRVNDPALR